MEQGDIKTYKIEVHFDNLCPGSVQNEELGGAAELQGVGHHPGPLRGRVLLLVRQGPDDAGAGVRVTGHVERPRHHRRHLQQPQRSVVTSQPSTTRTHPVTNVTTVGPHNHQHPYLSAMVNNGSVAYDHDRDGTHQVVGGCELKFRNKDYETLVAIRYAGLCHCVDLFSIRLLFAGTRATS